LLEAGRLDIEAITGTSAGDERRGAGRGLSRGRPRGCARVPRQILAIGQQRGRVFLRRAKVPRYFLARRCSRWPCNGGPIFFTLYSGPYDFNPLNINPLRNHLEKAVDFAKVRALTGPKLFVAATNLQTGKIKVLFRAMDRRRQPPRTIFGLLETQCLLVLDQQIALAWARGRQAMARRDL
jgi:NTE family protein